MSSRTKESSVNNNKNWDDVLAHFDIQNQDDSDLLGQKDESSTSVSEDKTSLTPRWATRAILLVGCATALGNIPLQSYLPNSSTSHFEITLNKPAGVSQINGDTVATPVVQYASIAKSLIPTPVLEASSSILNKSPLSKAEQIITTPDTADELEARYNEEIQELSLPKHALVTYTGHELINTDSTWHTYTVQRYDNPTNIFSQIKQRKILRDLKKIGSIADALKDMKKGTIVRAKSHNGKLEQLAFTPDHKNSFVIQPTESGSYEGSWQKDQFEVRQARATFSVKNGLFLDGKRVDVPNNIIRQVVTVFDWDIDFSHDVRVGDQVTVVFENIYHDGDLVGSQNLLAAEFINKGKIYRSIRHTTARGLTDYFTPEGREMKRAFIRTPVAHARVSSHFNPGRFHPVLHKLRAHKGTDFAARRGTPIIATGDGEVKLIGKKGGYGNTIILKHREGYTTLYSHLSKFKKNLKRGQVVAQGDIIGYVGSSGLATGPHLHYEFRRHNIPSNPLTVVLPNSMSLTKKELVKFKVDAINMKLQLNVLHRFAMEKFDINSATGG
ncbi:MAG: peptidoglycan DD-metalloendopeptidase family protein [Leucothrix sp.]